MLGGWDYTRPADCEVNLSNTYMHDDVGWGLVHVMFLFDIFAFSFFSHMLFEDLIDPHSSLENASYP